MKYIMMRGNVLLEITILIVQYLVIRKYSKGQFLDSIELSYDEHSVKYVYKGVCVGLTGTILIYLTTVLMHISFYEGTGFKFYESKIVLSFIISMFIRAFFAGVCEEVFFRGILLNYLTKYKGKTFGILISSLIFTMFHCSRYTGIY
ncbi:CPBP family intramembrane glutamic endopeptidase [Clostridium acidisoli]|uniref:CPBP family intramembrane glutamic endopeptidase n=1 Tax=Clostridium acidisoli TaxID=91624 RepID=UPI001A9A6A97|nr:CPBP family intramembrane glutamic endopeptidase [Clostridium acidisoli]